MLGRHTKKHYQFLQPILALREVAKSVVLELSAVGRVGFKQVICSRVGWLSAVGRVGLFENREQPAASAAI